MPAVGNTTDPRRSVNREPVVAAVLRPCLPSVEPDPNPDSRFSRPLILSESTLRVDGSANAVGGSLKGEEERVALSIDEAAPFPLTPSG